METKDALKAIGGAAFDGLFPMVTTLGFLAQQTKKAMEENASKAELREMAERQELQLRMAEAQAKIAQELAIARQIETANEMELEEYYEYVGGGGGSIQGNVNTGDIGLSGNGEVRRISKRIFKFKRASNSEVAMPLLKNSED